MHWGQGLAPIPLFCLGLALGYVYDRAGTILPCIVTHFLINATAMTLATLSALFP
jgi:membrane protease YdiL (CAAX protease family)